MREQPHHLLKRWNVDRIGIYDPLMTCIREHLNCHVRVKTHGYIGSTMTLCNGHGTILYTGQGNKVIPFLWFTTWLGHHILIAQTNKELVTNIRHTYHVPHTTIAMFCQQLWKQERARWIITFQWLLIHRSLSIGVW